MPEAAAAIIAIELRHDLPLHLFNSLHDELRDAVAAVDAKWFHRVGVEQDHLDLAARIADPVRHLATLQSLPHLSAVRNGHVRIRPHDDVHAARRGQEIL